MIELFKSTANSNFIELTCRVSQIRSHITPYMHTGTIICRVFSDPVTYHTLDHIFTKRKKRTKKKYLISISALQLVWPQILRFVDRGLGD